MDAYLIIGTNCDLSKFNFTNSFVVGIDKGALIATQNKIKLDLAVGDFDSISKEELSLIEARKIIHLNPIKDETDTLYALRLCKDYEKIYLLGGIQGARIEHFVTNLCLFAEFPNLIIIDDNSMIRLCSYEEDFHKDEYQYHSFFALEDVMGLSLKGFKYELNNYNLKMFNPLGVSNEITNNAHLSYQSGKLLMIKTKKEEVL